MAFLLKDVHAWGTHYEEKLDTPGPDMETVDMIVAEAAKFAEEALAPLNETADEEGCTQTGPNDVTTPKGFKEAYEEFCAGGWQGLSYPEEYGGQGLPPSLAVLTSEMSATANWTWTMFPGLSKGAINTIMLHGVEALKQKYLEKMISGEWTGTMCLTEPQCGSDLGLVSTKAEPLDDGTYKITGTKIFISCGEHDFTENIVHCVLARLPGAPEGTKGISLFAVPKRVINEDGSCGDINGLSIGRIEKKMGCHGSPTCEINFEGAVGELIGAPNRGLNHMFTFINTSRLGTAIQGLAAAEASFQNALPYARDRLAMRSLSGSKNPNGPADPIIVHPGVRKLLMFQKAIAEGGRSMVYECAKLNDHLSDAETRGDEVAAKKVDDRMGFLTPILKGFLTEVGLEAANAGIQIFGGHGYIKSNKQEQIVRDVRIASVWEGTTQIQALDLLGRKVFLQKLKPINEHCSELRSYAWKQTVSPASSNHGHIRSHATTLLKYVLTWHAKTLRIGQMASSNKDAVGSASVDYLMFAGYVQMAYHWLQMEVAAARALEAGDLHGDELAFYEAKLKTAHFYFSDILPRAGLHSELMVNSPDSVMALAENEFSFEQ